MVEVEATACEKEAMQRSRSSCDSRLCGVRRPAAQSEPLALLHLSLPRTGIFRRQPAADHDGKLETEAVTPSPHFCAPRRARAVLEPPARAIRPTHRLVPSGSSAGRAGTSIVPQSPRAGSLELQRNARGGGR